MATAFSYVTQSIGYTVQALGWFIDHLVPDFISHVGQGMEQWGKDMVAEAKASRQATSATNDFTDALKGASVNIPTALPLAYMRQLYGGGMPSVPGTSMGGGGGGGGSTGGGSAGGGHGGAADNNYMVGSIVIQTAATDGGKILDQIEAELRKRKGSGQTVAMDRYYQLRTT